MNEHLPEGYFDDADVAAYRALYESLPASAETAEVGVWLGRSICSVADIITREGMHVTCVDTFAGTQSEKEKSFFDIGDRDAYGEFIANAIRARILPDHGTVLKGDSVAMADFVLDESLDFVFIDADHAYEAVRADIKTWLPKVKSGGILAGDDYTFVSVQKAVQEIFEIEFSTEASLWIHRKR